jgi:PAS domain S-box-containing protein
VNSGNGHEGAVRRGASPISAASEHYLERELLDLVQSDAAIFRFLEAGSLDGVWYWDLTDPAQEWLSPRFWEVFGYDAADKRHLASEWQDMIHPEDLEVALENFQKHCADPSHPYDQLVRYLHADGSTVWVRCRGIAIRDADGKPIRMLGAHNEVTALKRAEEELAAKAAELERSNAELARFAHVVSHDLRSPLHTIAGFVELLALELGDELSDAAKRHVEFVRDGVFRISRLVDDLLAYSKVGGADTEPEVVDLAAVFDEVHASLAAEIAAVGGKVERHYLPRVLGQHFEFQQLFQNLVSNAVRYRSDDRPLKVVASARRAGAVWCVEVEDNGRGVSPEQQERVFELFERGHRVDRDAGTGMGLALCRRIVERQGGEISLTSDGVSGSVVRFSWPAGAQLGRAATGVPNGPTEH